MTKEAGTFLVCDTTTRWTKETTLTNNAQPSHRNHLAAWKKKTKATPKAHDEIKITHNLDKSRRYNRLGLKFVKTPALDGSPVL
ncbi:hypothetical protein OUZ56_006620 [Daphnia magna]|uniref:Uncharacterized protein n=1 Tax=Daphnia magna TaxID=35525 RepID=A0ABQ9YW69_9CRUS|nr:hypothetical protein OUZ56_006620 [Daphnia magna]